MQLDSSYAQRTMTKFEIFPLNVSADHLIPNWGRGAPQDKGIPL